MIKALTHRWAPHWQALQKREQRLVLAAAALVLIALVWWIALAPALHTLRQFGPSNQALEQQIDQMRVLRQQALSLQAQSKAVSLTPASAQRNLQSATTDILGAAGKMQVLGDRATIRLQNAPASTAAQWLEQSRERAHALPVQVDITSSGPATAPLWNGTLTMSLPTQ